MLTGSNAATFVRLEAVPLDGANVIPIAGIIFENISSSLQQNCTYLTLEHAVSGNTPAYAFDVGIVDGNIVTQSLS